MLILYKLSQFMNTQEWKTHNEMDDVNAFWAALLRKVTKMH